MPIAAIGIGSNLDNPQAQVRRAIGALWSLGELRAVSGIYRTIPWGKRDQPDFFNAVALLDTDREPAILLNDLKALERRLGRTPGEPWGPRIVDLDILTYDDLTYLQGNLEIPHRNLMERGFALIPLAEIDDRYAAAAQALPEEERAGVLRVAGSESVGPMLLEDRDAGVLERVRTLVQAFVQTDLVRLRIEDENEDAVEIARRPIVARPPALAQPVPAGTSAVQGAPERITADLVGIIHFTRPAPKQGDRLSNDRELAFVEALGIRNPVRSRGPGRLAAVRCADGQPVEYGQVLFEIERL